MAGLIVALALLTFFFGRKDRKGFDSRTISYAAVCIAMSFALSYLAPIHLPYGGSVTIASLLPLMIYSYMFGVRKGVFAGAIYGLLQVIRTRGSCTLHNPFDYPIAFAGIGLAGMFRGVHALDKAPQVKFLLGASSARQIRYLHLFRASLPFGHRFTTGLTATGCTASPTTALCSRTSPSRSSSGSSSSRPNPL